MHSRTVRNSAQIWPNPSRIGQKSLDIDQARAYIGPIPAEVAQLWPTAGRFWPSWARLSGRHWPNSGLHMPSLAPTLANSGPIWSEPKAATSAQIWRNTGRHRPVANFVQHWAGFRQFEAEVSRMPDLTEIAPPWRDFVQAFSRTRPSSTQLGD